MDNIRKVEGFPGLVKNMDSHVVINNDISAYKEYKDKKTLINTVASLQNQVQMLTNLITNPPNELNKSFNDIRK